MTIINSRAAFLSGTSSRIAALLSLGLMGLALPATAHAADECETVGQNPSANGNAPDSYLCTQPTYADGITYSSDGNLTVATSPSGAIQTGPNGVKLTGNSGDAVNWVSTGATVRGQGATVIDITTQSGAIDVRTGAVQGVAVSTTGVIRAVSQNGGAVSVNMAGAISTMTPGATAVEAVSQGGNGNVSVTKTTGAISHTGGTGILARAAGTGSIVLNITGGGAVTTGTRAADSVGVDAIAESGSIAVNLIGGSITSTGNSGATGTALRTNTGGNVTITMEGGSLGGGRTKVALDATIAAGRTASLRADAASRIVGDIKATGAGRLIVESDGFFETGGIDLTGLSGGSSFTLGETAKWSFTQEDDQFRNRTRHDVLFSAGDDTFVNEGQIFLSGRADWSNNLATTTPANIEFAFGAGTDSFVNSGLLVINDSRNANLSTALLQDRVNHGTTLFSGLETFTNSGRIILGTNKRETTDIGLDAGQTVDGVVGIGQGTDRWYDDVLSMPGTRWISDGGEVVMDVDLNRYQSDCTTRDASGALGAADCLMFVGGSTEGVTNVTLREVLPGDRGRYDPEGIVLVDVSGGTSEQGHFIVGPKSSNYSTAYGGSIDKGVFNAFIVYDETTQQHRLVSLPGPTGLQFPQIATAAQGLWRTTTASWFDRQAELRGEQEKGLSGGVWLRASGERTDRDVTQTAAALGQVFASDTSYKQTNMAINGGVDILVGGGADSAWAVGLMGGYGRAKVRFDNSPNRANLEGYTFGGYASLVSGGLFVDAAVNANILELEEDAPQVNLFPAGTLLHTDVKSIGVQIEAGYRLPLNSSGLFVEPQLGLSWVRTNFDDLIVPADDPTRLGVIAVFDDPTSFRGTLGGRIGIERPFGGGRAELSLLGRVAKEFKGDNRVILQNRGPDALVTDTLDGEFGEVALRATVSSANQGVSGIFTVGGKFQSGYSAGSISVGVRARW